MIRFIDNPYLLQKIKYPFLDYQWPLEETSQSLLHETVETIISFIPIYRGVRQGYLINLAYVALLMNALKLTIKELNLTLGGWQICWIFRFISLIHKHQLWWRSSENTNRILREYSPKGQSLDNKSNGKIQEIVDKLNFHPKKCLDCRTSYAAYFGKALYLIWQLKIR